MASILGNLPESHIQTFNSVGSVNYPADTLEENREEDDVFTVSPPGLANGWIFIVSESLYRLERGFKDQKLYDDYHKRLFCYLWFLARITREQSRARKTNLSNRCTNGSISFLHRESFFLRHAV